MIETATPMGVRLIGGEMLRWSDAPGSTPGAIDELVARLTNAGDRVLLAGAHEAALLDLLVERQARVACVMRSLPDAQETARRHADRDTVTVACGGIEKIAAEAEYDLVLVPSGLERALSTDSPQLPWAEVLHHLTAMLKPGGRLVVAVENDLGLHRLSDAMSPTAHRDDEDWGDGVGLDSSRPANPEGLAAVLSEAGMTLEGSYAAFGPSLLVQKDAPLPGETFATLVAMACGGEFAGHPVVSDPRWIARGAVRAGLAAHLAPGWVAVASKGAADHRELPGVLIAEGVGGWAVVSELTVEPDGRVERRPCGGERARRLRSAGDVTRDPDRLHARMPVGLTVEEAVFAACERADVRGCRALLRDYAAWLGKHAVDGQVGGHLVFATMDNVVIEHADHVLLDPSWEWAGPVALEQVIARALRRFALRLLASGQRHPWPNNLDIDGVCATLHAMCGYPAKGPVREKGVTLEAEVVSLQQERPVAKVLEHVLRGSPSYGRRELVAVNARLTDRLTMLQERCAWSDDKLAVKEAQLKKLQAQLDRLRKINRGLRQLRHSTSFRVGKMVTAPLRVVRRQG
ncbi:MAG: hypothetical protein HOV86_21655 [Thermoactinospora sp.]|nr:hypothetical protein [Thermoactinospora sp.]